MPENETRSPEHKPESQRRWDAYNDAIYVFEQFNGNENLMLFVASIALQYDLSEDRVIDDLCENNRAFERAWKAKVWLKNQIRHQAATAIDEQPSDLQVCQSQAGYYIGRICADGSPYSRDSALYYPTQKAAQDVLDQGEWEQPDPLSNEQ